MRPKLLTFEIVLLTRPAMLPLMLLGEVFIYAATTATHGTLIEGTLLMDTPWNEPIFKTTSVTSKYATVTGSPADVDVKNTTALP